MKLKKYFSKLKIKIIKKGVKFGPFSIFFALILIAILVSIPITVLLVNRVTSIKLNAAQVPVNLFLTPENFTVTPNNNQYTLSLLIDTKSQKIGFVNAEIIFDISKINLSSEISVGSVLTRVVNKTSMNEANATGKISLSLALDPNNYNNSETVFELARIPLIISPLNTKDSVIIFASQSVQIVDLSLAVLPFTFNQAIISYPATPAPTIAPTISPTITPVPSILPTPAPTILPTSTPTAVQFGLKGYYYNNKNLGSLLNTRVDQQINFNWGRLSPFSNMDPNTFSIRWTGKFIAPTTGVYTFYTQSDDGVRLWINDQILINDWKDHTLTERSGSISLSEGIYNIKLEYYENRLDASINLLFQGPNITKKIIPSQFLITQ